MTPVPPELPDAPENRDPGDPDRTVIRPTGMPGMGPRTAPGGSTVSGPRAAVGGSTVMGPGTAFPTRTSLPVGNDMRTQMQARTPEMQRTQMAGPPPAPPPAPADDMGSGLPIGTRLGEFEITSMVGEGGFGIVYLAHDHSLGRRVALKEYMPSALAARTVQSQVAVKSPRHAETFQAGLKSFINEARLLAQFDHASLVKVYRFWEGNGTAYMVMPFYEGKNLRDTLRSLGRVPDEAWLLGLLAPLTEALAVIHAEQCFHRDIAPDNVMMLAGSGRPLLLDFGAARRVIGDMTQALTVILKPGYAPVEQYAEIPGMKQGAWTDLYALAAVVYFAIVGKTPPPSVGRMLNDTFVPLAQSAAGRYSDRFLRAIDRALTVRPELRTQSVQELRLDLGLDEADIGFDEPGSSPAASRVLPSGPTTRIPTAMPGDDRTPGARTAMPASTRSAMPQTLAGPGAAGATIAWPSTQVPTPAAAPIPRTGFVRTPGTDTAPVAPVVANAAPAVAAPPRKSPLLWIGIAAAAAVLLAVGVFVFTGKQPDAPVADSALASAPPPAPATAVTPSPTTAVPAASPTATPPATTAAATPTSANPGANTPISGPVADAGVFDVGREFDRIVQAQSAGFNVEAKANKTTLKIDQDELTFTLKSEREGFVYVFLYGADKVLMQLYPNIESGSMKIKKGETLKLPQGRIYLQVTEPPGPGQLLALVSARQRDHSELKPRMEGGHRYFATGAESAQIAARHAGPLPVLTGRALCPGSGSCDDEFGAAVIKVNVVR
jgi:hypothetical protein